MEKSLFTGDKIASALEKMFIMDRFVLWEGKETPAIIRFLNHWNISDDKTLKIYKDDGYYLVPVGSWIVRAPDGGVHAFGEGVRFVSNETKKLMDDLQDKFGGFKIPITRHEEEKPITTYIPEDPYETEVVQEGNSISLRHKLDKDGKSIFKKTNETQHIPSNFIKELEKFKKRQE
jgi:hypothetical protein